MVNNQTYLDAGLPLKFLGRGWKTWTRSDIGRILEHHGVSFRSSTSKLELLRQLHEICEELDLRREHFEVGLWNKLIPLRHRDTVTGRYLPAFTIVRDIECSICLQGLSVERFPNLRITSSCNHFSDVCVDCLRQSIASQFAINVWDQIYCPICKQRLGYMDMKTHANPDDFERYWNSIIYWISTRLTKYRYDKYSLEACLTGGQFQRCRVPSCQSSQQCFPEADSYMICRDCGGRTCITCDTVWHPEITCEEIERREQEARVAREAEEKVAATYLDQHSKLCPNCHARGTKVTGCDHIKCKNFSFLRFQFPWLLTMLLKVLAAATNIAGSALRPIEK